MKFVKAEMEDAAKLCLFWNRFAEKEILHKQMDEMDFSKLWMENNQTTQKITLMAMDGQKLIGFANGCYVENKPFGYITFVLVDPEYRHQKVGTMLLVALEQELQKIASAQLEYYDVIFFNPINLEWIIPGTPRHDHPNAPGVDMGSDGFIWLKNCGYRARTYENSFYQPIQNFAYSDAILQKMKQQKQQRLGIAYYDSDKHYGMRELMDNLDSDDWKQHIYGNLEKEHPDPILIAYSERSEDLDEKGRAKAVGFTGPLRVQQSGRGFFAGIGVHSEYRQYGLGKVLFSGLCNSLKEMGAVYMTLFTGEENPARNIYESAGFKIVRSWSTMRRKVSQHDQYNRMTAKKMLADL